MKYYEKLAEHLERRVLPNGLTVLVNTRPGFTKKYAYFATDYGSIHREFTLDGQAFTAPQGVAHYLEHKMFELPGGRDVSAEFAALGAKCNAFTSFDMTAYLFTCTENFQACLDLLLEFVSVGYFTDESVQREQGIIGQEIGMNEDSPENRVFEMLMELLYASHPISQPILGTRESIARITPEILDRCHRAFYRPENMVLCVVGDVDPEAVVALAQARLPGSGGPAVTRVDAWPEAMTPVAAHREAEMEVAMPMFQLAFKCEPLDRGYEAIRREVIGDLAAEALFGESSELYLKMYTQGLIDSAFGGGFETVDGMAMLTASGDSEDPQAVLDAIVAQGEKLAREGVTEEAFLRMKRSALGRRIRELDSFDTTCFRLCAYHFSDYDYFDFPEIYNDIRREELQDFLGRVVRRERSALAVIRPQAREERSEMECV